MIRKHKYNRLFHKELSIYDFTIPEFLKWFAEQDISKYVKIVRTEIPEPKDELLTSVITVINTDGTPYVGAEVLIAGIIGVTDESGQCTITNIPILDEYTVSLVAGDNYVDAQTCSPDTIASIIFTVPMVQFENNEENKNIEEGNEITED